MTPSYRFCVAPRFPSIRSLEGRVQRNAGTERRGRHIVPRGGWRSLDQEELAAVTSTSAGSTLQPGDIGLFSLTERLRTAFWTEVAKAGADPASSAQGALVEILEFLKFKRLPLPDRGALRVTANLPDADPSSPRSAGLAFGTPPPIASINLGDEATSMVLLPFSPSSLASRLVEAGVSLPDAEAPAVLVARFFEAFPDEPLLLFRLEAGEGLWLPSEGVIHDRWTKGREDVEVILQLTPEVTARPAEPEFRAEER